MRKINKAGLNVVKSFEGLFLKPYMDPIKIPTIGYGTIRYENDMKVSMQDPAISEERATELLMYELNKKASAVEKMVKTQINENEFSALVSLSYNVGTTALQSSTLLKLLNANADKIAIADQFLRWNKAGGKELKGLTLRRQAERSLFLQPEAVSVTEKLLPSGPSEEEIDEKLKQIENDILK